MISVNCSISKLLSSLNMNFIKTLFAVVCVASFASCTPFDPRIINGTESKEQHPWVAEIVIDKILTPQGYLISADCGGSLIAPQWVLTAKHCLLGDGTTADNPQIMGNPDNYQVIVGDNNYQQGQFIDVTNYFFYSTYNNSDDDIALLKLANAPDGVDPISWQKDNIPDSELDGKMGQLYGWGMTEINNNQSTVTQLRETKVKLYTEECVSNMLCWHPQATNTNACQGDSGGPMTLLIDNVQTLVGVTHASYGDINDVPCTGPTSKSTKTFYPDYAEWIQSTMDTN